MSRTGIVPPLGLVLLLAACGSPAEGPDPAVTLASESPSSPSPSPPTDVPAVAGFAPGEIPPIPSIVIPDLSMVDRAIAGASITIRDEIGTYPGLTVRSATCDAAGEVTTGGGGTMALYGDGQSGYAGPDGTMHNFGDGTGTFTLNGIEVNVFGDGAGSYDDPANGVSFMTSSDGSGSFVVGDVSISVSGDGNGNEYGPGYSITVGSDGSGEYKAETNGVTIQNRGDGSAYYEDDTISITNLGDGTATVNGVEVPADPVPPVPAPGKFPPVATLAPMTSCGTTIALDAGLLFDFGESELRPETGPVLDSLAKALAETDAQKLQVFGHTDSVGDEASNLTLSQARADGVAAALKERGVTATIEPVGFGETRPVAPNEMNGTDNPAGRQLNRRVEVFVPAS